MSCTEQDLIDTEYGDTIDICSARDQESALGLPKLIRQCFLFYLFYLSVKHFATTIELSMFSLAAKQRLCLATRRTLVAIPRIPSRSISASALPSIGPDSAKFKSRRLAFAAGGTGVAVLSLLLLQNGSKDPEDPRDVKALSTVPFPKLVSGWM